MTFDQLRVFVAIAERGHLTRAAERLGISQSGASAAIKSLEGQYKVKLFNRVGRSIELSISGQALLPRAKVVLESVNSARQALENLSEGTIGAVTIAASQTIAGYWLPRRLASFQLFNPTIDLHVIIGNTREVEAHIEDGTADIGLVEGRTRCDLLCRKTVAQDELVLVAAMNFDSDDGRLDIRNLRWVVREPGSGTREALADVARSDGVSFEDLRIVLVLPSNEAVRQAVECGAGATIISTLIVDQAIKERRLRRLPFRSLPRDFAILSHRDRALSKAQAALKAYLQQ